MNKDLAKTLTTAIVQFIDRERPEGTMDCSNSECKSLEQMFRGNHFDMVESFIQKKLTRLTEFEQGIRDMIINALTTVHTSSNGQITSTVTMDDNTTHLLADGLLELAKKELLKDDEYGKKHLEGYIMGREDTMREMKDFIESHFNTNKAKEGEDLTDLYRKEYERNPEPIPDDVAYHFPYMPITRSGWGCDGTHCINPQMDCINCPRKITGGSINTCSGTSTLKAEG